MILSFIVVSAFLALYAGTLLPDVLPADAGEFQLVARTAGVAHPPGYPLYTMLGWVFARAPIGATPAWRVNLFSAVTAAATLGLVFSTARKLTGSIVSGLVAVLTLGSATTFWATATQASIRPLTAFFMALCLYALTHHASWIVSQPSKDVPHGPRDAYLVLFSLALSLGLTHHPSLAFPGIVFVAYLMFIDPTLLRCPRRWLKPAAALIPGFLVLVYLPLSGPPELATLSGFLDHVLARGFRGDMFALSLLDRLVLLPTLLRFQFNVAILLGVLGGALLLLVQDRKLAFLLIGSVVVHTVVTLTYDAPQTVEYAMPAYVSLALLTAVPFGRISNPEPETQGSRSTVCRRQPAVTFASRLALVVLCAAGVLNLLTGLPSYRTLSDSRDTREYAETVLSKAPPHAVVLSNWHWFSPFRYLQHVEGLRPDVAVEYVAPRGEPLGQTWVGRIEEHIERHPVVVVRYFEPLYRDLPYRFEPLGEAFVVRREPKSGAPTDMTKLDVTLGEQIELLGFRLEMEDTEPAQPVMITLAWSSRTDLQMDMALFAQLIGPDGHRWSAAEDPRHQAGAITAGEVVIDRFVVYPLLHASPGDYHLVVGAYSSDGRLTTGDGSDAVQLSTVRVHPSTTRPVTEHRRLVRFDGGPTLIGVDFDVGEGGAVRTYLHWAGPGELTQIHLTAADDADMTTSRVPALKRGEYATIAVDRAGIPDQVTVLDGEAPRRWNLLFRRPVRLPSPKRTARYIAVGDAMVLTRFDAPVGGFDPGSSVSLGLHFRGQRPLERDFIVSASLTGLEPDSTWSWRASHDTVPALGAIPTLKWIHGSAVLDPHRMTIPPGASPVPVVGTFLVYDHFTQRLLPPLDERLDPIIELSTWNPVPQ